MTPIRTPLPTQSLAWAQRHGSRQQYQRERHDALPPGHTTATPGLGRHQLQYTNGTSDDAIGKRPLTASIIGVRQMMNTNAR
jgi:hypothetical protein